jgi:hypothetical protein
MDSFASYNLIASIFSEPETETQPTTPVDADMLAAAAAASAAPSPERFFSREVFYLSCVSFILEVICKNRTPNIFSKSVL